MTPLPWVLCALLACVCGYLIYSNLDSGVSVGYARDALQTQQKANLTLRQLLQKKLHGVSKDALIALLQGQHEYFIKAGDRPGEETIVADDVVVFLLREDRLADIRVNGE